MPRVKAPAPLMELSLAISGGMPVAVPLVVGINPSVLAFSAARFGSRSTFLYLNATDAKN